MTFEIVPAEMGLEPAAKTSIETAFSGFFQQAAEWKGKAETITDPKEARAARLSLVKLRTSADKTRAENKAQYLRMGKAIDGANNIFLAMVVPIEEKLEAIEKAEERRIEAERFARATERLEAVKPYVETGFIPPLGDMTEDQFLTYFHGAKLLHQAKIEAAAKAEAERIEREAKEAAEREAQRLENIRLKAEAEAREKDLQAERAAREKERIKIEAAAKAERAKAEAARIAAEESARKEWAAIEAKAKQEAEAREKAEREVKALRDAEVKRSADIETARIAKEKADAEAAKKAESAPDKAKLIEFSIAIRNMPVPTVKSSEANAVRNDVCAKLESFAKWIESQTANI
jgi:hypothetical protein